MSEPILKLEGPDFEAIADTRELTREQWLGMRRQGLGGSDSGAVMQMNPYSSRFMVALEKYGKAPEKEETDGMKHGKRMEPVLRHEFVEVFREATGLTVEVYESPWMYRSKLYPWMLADIDGVIRLPPEGYTTPDGVHLDGLGGMECKAVSYGKEWANDCVPDTYYCQDHHYMTVLGFKWMMMPVLILNRIELRIVPLQTAFQARLIDEEKHFWDDIILKGELPAPDGVDDEDDYLMAMYPNQNETAIANLPADMEVLGERYLELTEEENAVKAEKEKIKSQYKLAIGTAKVGIAGEIEATWNRFGKRQFDKDRFSKDYPGVYDRYCEESPTSRFTVKRRAK